VKESSKSVNNWQSYKQEGGCFVHVVRLATTLPKVEENAHNKFTIHFLPVTMPNIHRLKKFTGRLSNEYTS